VARIITKELAIKICTKLCARDITPPNAAHDRYGVFHNGVLVASFGIRRGSSKDMGHDFIPKEINVRTSFAKQLAICTKSREDYLREIKLLPALPESPAVSQLPESSKGEGTS
jgi:hypothetical protein